MSITKEPGALCRPRQTDVPTVLKKQSGLIAAVMAVTLTASCSASETEKPGKTGAAERPGTAQEQPLTAEGALGDLSAVDFCGLLDDQALKKVDAEVDFTVPSFQHCLVGVDTPSTTLTLMIGGLYDESAEAIWPSEDEKLQRSVRRQTIEAGAGCLRTLLFADGIGVQIFAQGLTDAEQVDEEALCRVTDAVTDGVAEAAFSEETVTRSFRTGSLAELEPCALLDDADVSGMFDADMVAREHIGGHGCTWGQAMGASIELTFEVSLLADLSEFSTELEGRPTKVVSDEMSCEVSTPHIRSSADDPNTREVLALSATTFDERSCQAAEELAALVWPQLSEFQS